MSFEGLHTDYLSWYIRLESREERVRAKREIADRGVVGNNREILGLLERQTNGMLSVFGSRSSGLSGHDSPPCERVCTVNHDIFSCLGQEQI
jgi:hypothetical protein